MSQTQREEIKEQRVKKGKEKKEEGEEKEKEDEMSKKKLWKESAPWKASGKHVEL